MITNFEDITKPLTADELKLVEPIMSGLERRTIKNPILGPDIVAGVNARLSSYGVKSKMSGARLRKIINYIRVNALLPVMSTTAGYYVSDDRAEIERQVQSLFDRASAIQNAAFGLSKFLEPKQPGTPLQLFDL